MEIAFDPTDPYPFFEEEMHSYEEEKSHSAKVDSWLGFSFEVEEEIAENVEYKSSVTEEYWAGLPVFALQTPYTEFRRMLKFLEPTNQTVIDLGCGYGRLAFVLEAHYPACKFVGFEALKERVDEAQRVFDKHALKNSSVFAKTVGRGDFRLPDGDIFFMFDFGSEGDIENILEEIKSQARAKPKIVIARGKRTRHLIHKYHPWLAEVNSPRHFSHFSIYRS